MFCVIQQALINQDWVAKYYGVDSLEAFAFTMDLNGSIYIAGSVFNILTQYDYLVAKYDPSGNLLWAVTHNGSQNSYDAVLGIVVDNDGNAYVTGESENVGSGNDIVTIKYDLTGQQVWLNSFNSGGASIDVGELIAIDNEGNLLL